MSKSKGAAGSKGQGSIIPKFTLPKSNTVGFSGNDFIVKFDGETINYIQEFVVNNSIHEATVSIKKILENETDPFLEKLINSRGKIHNLKVINAYFDLDMVVILSHYELPLHASGNYIVRQNIEFKVIETVCVHRKDTMTGKNI